MNNAVDILAIICKNLEYNTKRLPLKNRLCLGTSLYKQVIITRAWATDYFGGNCDVKGNHANVLNVLASPEL